MTIKYQGRHVFSYSRGIPLFLFVVALSIIILAYRSIEEIGRVDKWAVAGICMLIMLIISALYIWSYSIVVDSNTLEISSLMRSKKLSISSIKKIEIYKGLKMSWIDLKINNDASVRIQDSIDNFILLCNVICDRKNKATPILVRDRFGETRELEEGEEIS